VKAMLLAAGFGERMRPLTLERPKPLLEVRGRPLIDYHLQALASAGIRDVVINVSWLGAQIETFCATGARWGLRIAYSREDEPLETAGGIVQALPLLGDGPFLVANADIYTDYRFTTLASRGIASRRARLVLVDNPSHNADGDFSLRGEQVLRGHENTLTFAGIGLYGPGFFAHCAPGKRPLLPLLLQAIEENRLEGEHFRGRWTDVGTPQRLAALQAAADRVPAPDHSDSSGGRE
jgi:MurNAc alpha-1-phosphate uridylyltransferase